MQDVPHKPSEQDRLTQLAHDTAHNAPDIRVERVAAAKCALENGALMLDPETLATVILSDPSHQVHIDL